MAKQEFLQNLRLARNLFVHRVEVDHPSLNADALSRRLMRAALWLTPAVVDGFDPKDFSELADDVRQKLERDVTSFRAVAGNVPDDGPASSEQIQAASVSLLNILHVLEPYFPAPSELEMVRNAMKRIQFPVAVETWDYEFGRDSAGEPALWIWIVVDNAAAADTSFQEKSHLLRRQIHAAMNQSGVERWPYVRFRTISEQKSLLAKAS